MAFAGCDNHEQDIKMCVVCSGGQLSPMAVIKPLQEGDCRCGGSGTCPACKRNDTQDDDLQDNSDDEEDGDGDRASPRPMDALKKAALDPKDCTCADGEIGSCDFCQLGPLESLPDDVCRAQRGKKCNTHWVHAKCRAQMTDEDKCPRCELLQSLLHVGADDPVLSIDAKDGRVQRLDGDPLQSDSEDASPSPLMLQGVAKDRNGKSFGGVRYSTKMIELKKRVRKIIQPPSQDKVLIFSFFKGFLDLVEGMVSRNDNSCACAFVSHDSRCLAQLEHDMKVRTERFDGDVGQDGRSKALERFKTDPDKRVLLATIHSGGVGLNITQANHVFFCDRWYDPTVLRCAKRGVC